MRLKSRIFAFVGVGLCGFVSLILTAHDANGESWLKLGGRYVALGKLEIKIPNSWRMTPGFENQLLLTRDGVYLQLFLIGMAPIDAAFPHTKKKLSPEASPDAIIDIAVENFRSNPAIANFKVVESGTATLGGVTAPRIVYSYEGDYGVKKMGIYSTLLIKDQYYFFQYQAPARHYFQRDQASVDDALRSLNIVH